MKSCLGPVNLLYLLRTSRSYKFIDLLVDFHLTVRDVISEICNVDISGTSWIQASLPVAFSGLGIRRTEALALPAFTASAFIFGSFRSPF